MIILHRMLQFRDAACQREFSRGVLSLSNAPLFVYIRSILEQADYLEPVAEGTAPNHNLLADLHVNCGRVGAPASQIRTV